MFIKKSNQTAKTSFNRSVIITVVILISFAFGILFGFDFSRPKNAFNFSLNSPKISDPNVSQINSMSFPQLRFQGYNLTHLWSFRVANENYLRIARLLPCRMVEYSGGPKPDLVDSCDYSSKNEFALENSIRAQKWLFEHQNPQNCSNKRFAIINNYALSGYGSIIHQVVWAFGMALAEDRIAVYQTPGNWFYGACASMTLDCVFLPISNCSVPTEVDGKQTIRIASNFGHWNKPVHHPVFQNRTFNWYRAQLIFYLMRFKPETLDFAQNIVNRFLVPPSVDLHRPYISLYVRRSDKVQFKEMSQAYSLRRYFDLFDLDARRANISTIFINSEEEVIFGEFIEFNKEKQNYYKLLRINVTRNALFRTVGAWSKERRAELGLEFLAGLFIEVNGDLHSGTLTSNWCRVVDEFRLVLGKLIPYYTPENKYLMNW